MPSRMGVSSSVLSFSAWHQERTVRRWARTSLLVGRVSLEEVAPNVGPAVDLFDGAVAVEVIVDDVPVGDEVALVPSEELVDRITVMLPRKFEEHVPSGCHDHPEVFGATLLFRLNENAGCVGADVGL